MNSSIYTGRMRHRRFEPVEHRFSYRRFMLYLDLAEWPSLRESDLPLGEGKFSAASFRRADHMGDPLRPLADAVADLVETETGRRPGGPIRLLTNLRQFGYYFSPLNLYYCFAPDGRMIEAVVAEVTNTPWRERHCYVLWKGNRDGGERLRFRHAKAFHVSPFMDMQFDYEWRLSEPGQRLEVELSNMRGDRRIFTASLDLRRRALRRWPLVQTLARHPAMSMRITAGIYFQALRLWMKRCPYYPHPDPGAEGAGSR